MVGVSDEALRKVEIGEHGASLDSGARESEALGLYLDEALRIARLAEAARTGHLACHGRH